MPYIYKCHVNVLLFSHLVTQNVDQLHLKAGSRDITELHGTNSVSFSSCLKNKNYI